jgi:hypothetical protein
MGSVIWCSPRHPSVVLIIAQHLPLDAHPKVFGDLFDDPGQREAEGWRRHGAREDKRRIR